MLGTLRSSRRGWRADRRDAAISAMTCRFVAHKLTGATKKPTALRPVGLVLGGRGESPTYKKHQAEYDTAQKDLQRYVEPAEGARGGGPDVPHGFVWLFRRK